ncbi:unnamed protein product [Rangifer tarandus platyrhynchus]|uniref:Uncharacterized protein n=2 Tax=Rangifer tarandus platyrhynchus TaxID=3082113 RepID=A0AC59ZYN8_RANTA|nr:unnamed protein product [Rangifer tarandus platyrhynchus]
MLCFIRKIFILKIHLSPHIYSVICITDITDTDIVLLVSFSCSRLHSAFLGPTLWFINSVSFTSSQLMHFSLVLCLPQDMKVLFCNNIRSKLTLKDYDIS